jgi:hypothetical protein
MSFEDNVKQWVLVDNAIRNAQTQLKGLREKKNLLSETINDYIETNELTNSQINISDGRLKYHVARNVQPLTLKFVKDCLLNCIVDEDKVEQLMDYMKSRRETREVTELKRYYNKTV